MKVPLNTSLVANACFFKQIIGNVSTVNFTLSIKVYLNELAEPGTIIVFKSFCISEGFKKRV
jgi:hypothetical protein